MPGRGRHTFPTRTAVAAMYSSYSFAPDRQPSRASADATGDTATTRAAMGLGAGSSRAWAEPAARTQTERHDIAVAQADGEP